MPTDNEKYTDSLIWSIQDYVEKLQYLARNERTTLRALNSYKIFHWLYSWADWYEISEEYKLKIEKLMNCIILRNSNVILPVIAPQSFYSNVNSPQNMETWQIITINPSSITNPPDTTYTLSLSTTAGIISADILVNPSDINGLSDATLPPSVTRIYNSGPLVQITAPGSLIYGNIFTHWLLNGVIQPNPQVTISVTMSANKSLMAVYREPYKLTVNATNGGFGVLMAVIPVDLSGKTDGTTEFERNYASGTLVQVTTPNSLVNGNLFDYWLVNGVINSNENLSITLNMIEDITLTAVYRLPQPPVGSITITKEIIYGDDPVLDDYTEFTIILSKNGAELRSGTVSQLHSLTFAGLELGTYSVTEVENPNYQVVYASNPRTVILTAGPTINQSVLFTNAQLEIIPTGTITVYKQIINNELNDIFTYHLFGTDTGYSEQGTSTIPAVFSGLSLGTYTLTEASSSGFSLVSIVPNDGNDQIGELTLDEDNLNLSFTVTNVQTEEGWGIVVITVLVDPPDPLQSWDIMLANVDDSVTIRKSGTSEELFIFDEVPFGTYAIVIDSVPHYTSEITEEEVTLNSSILGKHVTITNTYFA